MTKTQEILAEMFQENTGRHFLDSGDAYGRNWEKNQQIDLLNLPITNVKYQYSTIEFEYSTIKWLEECCQYEEELDNIFHNKFVPTEDEDESMGWLELMEMFPHYLSELENEDGELLYSESCGIYGEGKPITINTYNHETLLDQTIQFVYFTNQTGEYIVLQVHGGCDVRGGYTKPRVFSVGHYSELDIFDDARGVIHCTGKEHHHSVLALKEQQEKQKVIPGIDIHEIPFDDYRHHHWTTDDGNHWYYDGACGSGAGVQLEKFEVINNEEEDDVKWKQGKLLVEDTVMYCPHCGAKLAASMR